MHHGIRMYSTFWDDACAINCIAVTIICLYVNVCAPTCTRLEVYKLQVLRQAFGFSWKLQIVAAAPILAFPQSLALRVVASI